MKKLLSAKYLLALIILVVVSYMGWYFMETMRPHVYKDMSLGLELQLPNKNWVTSSDNRGSYFTFFESRECLDLVNKEDGFDVIKQVGDEDPKCSAVMIYNSSRHTYQNANEVFTDYTSDAPSLVERNSNIINGALVSRRDLKTLSPDRVAPPDKAWSYRYDVFFENEKEYFYIVTNDQKLEEKILSTIKLAK